jgi:hypothetical protein
MKVFVHAGSAASPSWMAVRDGAVCSGNLSVLAELSGQAIDSAQTAEGATIRNLLAAFCSAS